MWAFKEAAKGACIELDKPKGACSCISYFSIFHVHLFIDFFNSFHKIDYLSIAVTDILQSILIVNVVFIKKHFIQISKYKKDELFT